MFNNSTSNQVKQYIQGDIPGSIQTYIQVEGEEGARPGGREEHGGAPLGNTTKLVSTLRARRFMIQAGQRQLMPGERVGLCLRIAIPNKNVQVWHSPAQTRAHYKNLIVCGSVWGCAVCASKISERRRAELAKGLSGCNYVRVLITYTFQHDRGDKFEELRADFKQSMKRFYGGRTWECLKKQYGWIGQITGTETTWTEANGWHLHEHVLAFLDQERIDLVEMRDDFSNRYEMVMRKNGRYVSPVYGVDLAVGDDLALELYPNKWGLDDELTKSNVKNSRKGFSPFQLVEKYLKGEKWAGELYKEFAIAIKGCKQLRWSEGLRSLLGLKNDKSDLELAVEAVDTMDILLATLSADDWKIVLANDARASLLDVADGGDLDAVINYLRSLGCQCSEYSS